MSFSFIGPWLLALWARAEEAGRGGTVIMAFRALLLLIIGAGLPVVSAPRGMQLSLDGAGGSCSGSVTQVTRREGADEESDGRDRVACGYGLIELECVCW